MVVTWIICLFTLCAFFTDSFAQKRKYCGAVNGPPVHYDVGIREHDKSHPPVLMLQVSIAPAQASSEAAFDRLGCQLSADFPNEYAIQALIFDDKRAARSLALYAQDQQNHGTYLWHLRARYELNRRDKRQSIDFLLPYVDNGLLAVRRFKVLLDF